MKEIIIVRQVGCEKSDLVSRLMDGIQGLQFFKYLVRALLVMRRVCRSVIHMREADQQRLRRKGAQQIATIQPERQTPNNVLFGIRVGSRRFVMGASDIFGIAFHHNRGMDARLKSA